MSACCIPVFEHYNSEKIKAELWDRLVDAAQHLVTSEPMNVGSLVPVLTDIGKAVSKSGTTEEFQGVLNALGSIQSQGKSSP